MSTSTLGLFLRHLTLTEEVSRLGTTSDHKLLAAYESGRGQAAFAELMRRHGPMVLRTCRRVLGQGPDAEDAFQATFLMLARKARSIRKREALGSWLHRVAYRTALDVLSGEIRRRAFERRVSVMTHNEPDPAVEATWNEIRPILDAELDGLPDEARRLLIACYLQGKTHAEAAAELGLPRGSLARHLERARALLASRLAQHGVTVSAVLLAVALGESAKGAGVPAVLLVHTLEAALTFTERGSSILSANVARLVKSGLQQMAGSSTPFSLALVGWVTLLGAALTACQTLNAWSDKTPETPPAAEQPMRKASKPLHSDRFGDPLPVEALARMGTTRLRHAEYVYRVLFAPDGKTVASAGADGSVRLWDVTTGKLARRLQHPVRSTPPHAVSFVRDGKTLAYAAHNQLWLSDMRTGDPIRELKLKPEKNGAITVLAVSSDGKTVASAEGNAVIRLWDVATGNSLRVLHGDGKQIVSLSFSPDNQTLAARSGRDKLVQLWGVSSGKLLHTLEHPGYVSAICFSPDGKTFAAAASDKEQLMYAEENPSSIHLWDVAAGKLLHTLEGHQKIITALSFSPDGKLLTSGSWDRTIRLWDVATAKELRQLKGNRQLIQSLAFSPDGKMLASGGSGAAVRLWNVATGEELQRRDGMHKGFILAVSFSLDGRNLTTATVWKEGEDMVRTWDTASGKLLGRLEHPGGANSLAFAVDGKALASVDSEAVRVWDVTVKQQPRQLQALGAPPLVTSPGSSPLAFSPDGKLLATGPDHFDAYSRGATTGIVQLLDATNGTQLQMLKHPQLTTCATFSPDGKTLAVGTRKDVYLWDVATGKDLWRLDPCKGDGNMVGALAFSPDGKTLAVGNFNSKIYLLETSSGKELHTLIGHSGWVRTLAFSPNGRLLASGSFDHTVRLWEVSAGLASECHLFHGHDAEVSALAFSPDGRRLASGSYDSTALIWDVTGLTGKKAVRSPPLPPGELTACWYSLLNTDAGRAYRATRILAAAPDQTVPFLAERLREQLFRSPTPELVARLLAELDNDDFRVRTKATKELEKYGEVVEPALRQTLKANPSVEVRRRVKQLLDALHPDGVSPHLLRWLRAVEILEWIDNAAARDLLKKLAVHPPQHDVGQKAKEALSRHHVQRNSLPSEQH